ncbi:MAG: hypothetical protein AB8B51_16015 [Sedimentitalea sp.]
MPKYELKNVYVTSYATNGSSGDNSKMGLTGEAEGSETQGGFSYEEIKVRYPTLDPAKPKADQSAEEFVFAMMGQTDSGDDNGRDIDPDGLYVDMPEASAPFVDDVFIF